MKALVPPSKVFAFTKFCINSCWWVCVAMLTLFIVCMALSFLGIIDRPFPASFHLSWLYGSVADSKMNSLGLVLEKRTEFFLRTEQKSLINYLLAFQIFVGAGIITGIFWQLKRIFTHIDYPVFDEQTPKRITNIGLLLFLYVVFGWVHNTTISYVVYTSFPEEKIPFNVRTTFNFDILWALLVLVIAQVYKRGVQLQEEQRLTI